MRTPLCLLLVMLPLAAQTDGDLGGIFIFSAVLELNPWFACMGLKAVQSR